MKNLQLLSNTGCQGCRQLKRKLNEDGINFTEFDASKEDWVIPFITDDLGVSQFPVLVLKEGDKVIDFVTGFRPDQIRKLVAQVG